MAKNTSKEAYFERLKNLAEVNKTSLKESKIRNLGSLIDYKRAADGVAYGIVKENHSYFLKKAGTKQDPSVADFAYIGGLGNITNYQYKSLSEADKQRNMIFHTINEAITTKQDKNGSIKKRLHEDVSDEIDQASSKLGDLDAATAADDSGAAEMGAGLGAKPAGEVPAEEPAPAEEIPTGDEIPPAEEPAPDGDGSEIPTEPTGDENPEGDGTGAPAPEGDQPNAELEKELGKITNKVRKSEMEDAQVKSFINTFLSAFKDKLRDIDIEDRKEMANKILKVVGQEEIEDLGNSVPQDKPEGSDLGPEAGLGKKEEGVDEEECAECGGFGKYAESRGYGSPESFMECDDEEKANVISGYANANGEGLNDGDFKTIAIVITPEILEKLRGDYGHDDFANQVEPMVNGMNETSEEDKMAQLNELWGGLKNLGSKAVGGIKGGIQKGAEKLGNIAKAGAEKVGQAYTGVKQAYHAGEVPAEVQKLQGVAANLGKQIDALNKRMTAAGQQPIDVKTILKAVTQQVTGKGAGVAGLNPAPVAETVAVDPSNTAVTVPNMLKETDKKVAPGNTVVSEPNMLKEEDDELEPETDSSELEAGETPAEEKAEHEPSGEEFKVGEEKPFEKHGDKPLEFAPDSQSLGVGTIKPDGAGVEISIEPDKSIQISMAEAKKALIKTIAEGVNKYMAEAKPKAKTVAVEESENVEEDKKWIQKAVNPEHKGYCTPMSKPTCTPKRKALAKRFKKGIEDESVQMSESEQKLRKYVRNRLEEKAGLRKPSLNEAVKSPTLKKLDSIIDEQFKLHENVILKKKNNLNEVFGMSVAEKFAKLDPNNESEVNKLFVQAFKQILTNPQMGAINRVARSASIPERYELLKQYVEQGGGTLRIAGNKLIYAPASVKSAATKSDFGSGGTMGKTAMGGA
jgi:hypothetical protein